MQEESNARDHRGRLLIQPGMIAFNCVHCGVEFHDHPSQSRRYHSNECKAAARRRKETRQCKGCSATFEIHPSRSNVYHSPECYRQSIGVSAAETAAGRLAEAARRRGERADNRRVIPIPGLLPPDIDVRSYLMGIFDGEGCITGGYDKRDGRYFLVVGVCMASEPITRLFAATWGGTYGPRARLTVGGLTLWDWRNHSAQAAPFLAYAAEHSISKRQQATLALGLAANISKYAEARRAGFNPRSGGHVLGPDDHALRQHLVSEIRAINGARSRFKDQARLHLP